MIGVAVMKALAIVGVAQVLAALAPIAAEAAGPVGMAPSRGQPTQSYHGNPYPYPYPFYYRSHSYRSNYFRPNYYRPNYYRPYYYSYYYVPPVYVVPPSYSSAPSGYGATPGYGAPGGYYDMAPAPQIEREVIFAEGRYVLLGDGESVPFRWVWVPNPPTAPPFDTQDQR